MNLIIRICEKGNYYIAVLQKYYIITR